MACLGGESDWANLPGDILDMIVMKVVPPLSQYIRLALVCKPWRLAVYQILKFRHDFEILKLGKPIPLLMIPTIDKSKERRGLYNVLEKKKYELELPVPYNKRCCGVSHGWLAFEEPYSTINLINPFTGAVIKLPPVEEDDGEEDYFDGRATHINKVILSDDPHRSPDNYVIAVITRPRMLAILRARDKKWTNPTLLHGYESLSDAIFHEGRILAVSWDVGIVSVNMGSAHCEDSDLELSQELILSMKLEEDYGTAYIVRSTKGDIFVIQRIHVIEGPEDSAIVLTKGFKVFKLLEAPSGPTLLEVKELGNETLFLGDNNDSVCVVASDCPDCQPNSIYYTSDITGYTPECETYRDMGIFSLENEQFTQHYNPDPSHRDMPHPLWIPPPLPHGRLFDGCDLFN